MDLLHCVAGSAFGRKLIALAMVSHRTDYYAHGSMQVVVMLTNAAGLAAC